MDSTSSTPRQYAEAVIAGLASVAPTVAGLIREGVARLTDEELRQHLEAASRAEFEAGGARARAAWLAYCRDERERAAVLRNFAPEGAAATGGTGG